MEKKTNGTKDVSKQVNAFNVEQIAAAMQAQEKDMMEQISYHMECISGILNQEDLLPIVALANVGMVFALSIHGEVPLRAGFGPKSGVSKAVQSIIDKLIDPEPEAVQPIINKLIDPESEDDDDE